MCGLTGFLDFKRSFGAEDMGHLVTRMRDALAHRGPDDAGNWVDPNAGIALGHRRLSIVDLSPLGHQPMTSADGRYVLAFNGEIYNFEALRHELEGLGSAFRSRSDTEVVLAAVVAWGLPRALERFNGMFAIALWDRTERALFLARDRFGEKPLFYGAPGGTLLFGSELKALREHPSFDNPVIDRGSLAQFLRFLYVPTPGSIFVGVKKLPPASWLRIAAASDVDRAPTPYWSMREVASHGVAHRFEGSEADAVEALDQALRASVRMRMVADVPLGAFLSGGIDSSTIVALMQAQSSRPVRTFTIGFAEEAYNEAEHAKAVAKHLHTDHTELYVTPEQARAVIPRLPMLYDEPFADPSQVPTFLVSQLARQHVTVALSGDGGDELFGGYNRTGPTRSGGGSGGSRVGRARSSRAPSWGRGPRPGRGSSTMRRGFLRFSGTGRPATSCRSSPRSSTRGARAISTSGSCRRGRIRRRSCWGAPSRHGPRTWKPRLSGASASG